MSDVAEKPDLGIEDRDEALPDEDWEASVTQAVDAPESEALADDDGDLEEAEAEVEVEQPDATPVEAESDEAEQDELDLEDEREVEEKPKRKSTKKGAKAKGKPKAKAKAEKPKRTRTKNARERGALELDVKDVTDAFDDGEIELEEGQTLTPHRIARLIADRDGLDKPPSTGAITNIIKKWDEIGYALTHDKPLAYKRISARGKKEGLDTLKDKAKEKAKAERAKAKDDS